MKLNYKTMGGRNDQGCLTSEDSRLDRRRVQAPPMSRAVRPVTSTSYALNLTMVYDRAISQFRAQHLCERVTRIVGLEALSVASWGIHELDRPAVLAQALQSALQADVIMVSLVSGASVPVPLGVWIDMWLPRRRNRLGALVAVIGAVDSPETSPSQAESYLRTVAARGGLDFVPMTFSPRPSSLSLLAPPRPVQERTCVGDFMPGGLRSMLGLDFPRRNQPHTR
jgi:hypothetical protein